MRCLGGAPLTGLAEKLPYRGDVAIGGAVLMAAVLGLLVVRAPLLGVLGLLSLGIALGAVRLGPTAMAAAALAALPWFVILEGVAPPLLGTLSAAAGAGALALAVAPLRFSDPLAPIAAAGFVLVVGVNAVYATGEDQYIQAAKFIVFAAVVLVIASDRAAEVMPRLRTPLLASGLGAIVVHLAIVAAGLGNASSYYGIGERLGFAADGPHALALLTTIVAGVGLAMRRGWLQLVFFAPAIVAAMLTGVRSALVGIAVIMALWLIRSSSKPRALGVLAGLAAIVVVTGASEVVTSRFDREAGELSSFAAAGSGRGLIWTVALEGWGASGPGAWAFGAGLYSVVGFEIEALGSGLVGHSDLVEVLVTLGLLGFVSWAALWIALFRSGAAPLVLLPILLFGLANGTLEYVGAFTFGVCAAAACATGGTLARGTSAPAAPSLGSSPPTREGDDAR